MPVHRARLLQYLPRLLLRDHHAAIGEQQHNLHWDGVPVKRLQHVLQSTSSSPVAWWFG
jgi:hypothetical protein